MEFQGFFCPVFLPAETIILQQQSLKQLSISVLSALLVYMGWNSPKMFHAEQLSNLCLSNQCFADIQEKSGHVMLHFCWKNTQKFCQLFGAIAKPVTGKKIS